MIMRWYSVIGFMSYKMTRPTVPCSNMIYKVVDIVETPITWYTPWVSEVNYSNFVLPISTN